MPAMPSARAETNRSIGAPTKDWWVVGLAVATVLALGYSWLKTSWHQAIWISLPYRRMELPVAWWVFYLGYCVSASWFLCGGKALLSRVLLVDGFLLHVQWLLVTFFLTTPIFTLVGRAYGGYIVGVIGCTVLGTALRAGHLGCTIWHDRRRSSRTTVIRMPLVVGTLLMALYVGWGRQYVIPLLALLGFCGGWWVARRQLIRPAPIAFGRSQAERYDARMFEWAGIGALVLLAFCLRVAWYHHLTSLIGFDFRTGFPAASDDGQFYHSAATKLAAHLSLLFSRDNPVVSSSFDPLYPLLLGFWYRVAGVYFTPAVIVQCLLSSLSVALIYFIGKALGNGRRAVGYAAAGLVAMSQPLIFSSAVYGIEALYVPVLVLWIWSAVRYLKGRGSALVWMGVCGGLALGFRRYTPLLLIGLLPWMLWAKRSAPLGKRFIEWCVIVAIAASLYAPIEVMYRRAGQARLLGSQGGSTYWTAPSDIPDLVPDNRRLMALGIDPFRDLGGSVRRTLQQPGAVLYAWSQVLPLRLKAFFFWAPFGNFDTLTLINPTILNAFSPTAECYYLLLVLGGIGWALWRAETRAVAVLLLVMIGVHTFVHSVLFMTHSIRYSVPVRPFVMAFAAVGLGALWRTAPRPLLARREEDTLDDAFSHYPGLQQPVGR